MKIKIERLAKGLSALLLVTLVLLTPAFAQTTVLLPLPVTQFFNANGTPLANGSLGFYASGTFNAQGVFSDATGVTPLSNPVPLNAGGYPQNGSGSITGIWLTPGTAYRVQAKDANGVQQWLIDGVTGLSSSQSQAVTAVTFSTTPTFTAVGQNQLFTITLTGNVTSSTFNAASSLRVPVFVTFSITQDGVGSHTFAFPANSLGGASVSSSPSSITIQSFIWDGTTLQAISGALDDIANLLRFYKVAASALQLNVGGSASFGPNPSVEYFTPVITSGFGTNPSITASNGSSAFRINVGTGGTATSGVISPGVATTGWNCQATDVTTPGANTTKQSASTPNSVTFTNYNSAGTATAWTASDVIAVICLAY